MLRSFLGSWIAQTVFWLCLLGVITLSLMPLEHLPSEATLVWDKAQHALGFSGLTVLGLMAYPRHSGRLAIGLLAVGAFIEATQHLTGWRQGDLRDLVANAVGIALVVLMHRIASRVQKVGTTG